MNYEDILILRISASDTVAVYNPERRSLAYLGFERIQGYRGQNYSELRPLGLRPALGAKALYGADGRIEALALDPDQPYLNPSEDPRIS